MPFTIGMSVANYMGIGTIDFKCKCTADQNTVTNVGLKYRNCMAIREGYYVFIFQNL